jgi:protein SCO1/2
MKILLFAAAMALASHAAHGAPEPLPRDSVYQLDIPILNDAGQHFAWRDQRGQPRIVSMLYTSCRFTCPMLVDGAKAVRASLPPEERARLNVTFITLDPARDTVAKLAQLRAERSLEGAQWTLARVEPADVRKVASLLGVRYRALANGDFNHTSVLVLLDADGRIVARTERVGGVPDPQFVAAVRATLQAHPH